jgi:hypothetical protein
MRHIDTERTHEVCELLSNVRSPVNTKVSDMFVGPEDTTFAPNGSTDGLLIAEREPRVTQRVIAHREATSLSMVDEVDWLRTTKIVNVVRRPHAGMELDHTSASASVNRCLCRATGYASACNLAAAANANFAAGSTP